MKIIYFILLGYSTSSLAADSYEDTTKLFSTSIKNDALLKQNFIRNRFRETWNSFTVKSQGADEINPITGTPKVTWGGWGVTLIDSLDTLFIMNLTNEFKAAVKMISNVDFTRGAITTSFFEVTIRNLGGLISAHDLSGNKVLLKKAIELADVLMDDFNSPSGFPFTEFNFETQKPVKDAVASLANIGSCQLEFTRLSIVTKDKKYRNAALAVYDTIDKIKKGPGLFHSQLDVYSGQFINKEITFGAYGDSFFEYLLKLPIMLGKDDPRGRKYSRMFKESIEVLQHKLIVDCFGEKICLGRIDYQGNLDSGTQHLEFFVPGLLMLGGNHFNNQSLSTKGAQLLETFRFIPKSTPTGLAPEYITFSKNSPIKIENPRNSLRPELAESLFYAYRFTHDPKYRESAWSLFQGFEAFSKVNYGYAEYKDVTKTHKKKQVEGNMPSYFFAETFKYLYLIFCSDNVLSLNDWVFNTEAHPFRKSNNN